jgi:carotenoid cleavage dioxygenase-like enzyme
MHYSRAPKMTPNTQMLTVRGSLPTWLTGTISRQIEPHPLTSSLHTESGQEGVAALHTFAMRGGRVSYATCTPSPAPAAHPYADPARAYFRPLISPFSHTPADHAPTAQARAIAELAAYTAQPLAVEPDAALLACLGAPPITPSLPPGSLYARARFASGDVAAYRARARGVDTLGCVPIQPLPYIYSVCDTRRYVVLVMTPLVYSVSPNYAATLFDHACWQPELGAQFVAFERETGRVAGRWEADAFFTLHTFHAFERGDELLIDLVAYGDASLLTANARHALPHGTLRRYRLLTGARRATYEPLSNVGIELPRSATRRAEGEQRYAYGVSLRDGQAGRHYDQIVKIDLHSGRDRIWRAAGCAPGEPVIVRRPGARSEEDGVVLSVVEDAGSRSAYLLVLDAASLAEIGRAHLPQDQPPLLESHTPFALVY